MDAVRMLASLARAARDDANLRVRQPLRRMQVAVPAAVRPALTAELLDLLRSEVNVKAIELVGSDAELVRLRAKANFRTLGKKHGKRTPLVAAAAGSLSQEQFRALEAGEPVAFELEGAPITLEPDDLVIEREVTSDWLVSSSGPYVVALDPTLDQDLREEGLAREIVSRIQRLRREAEYEYTTRIHLWIDGDPDVLPVVRAHGEAIAHETLARRLEVGARAPVADVQQQFDIEGLAVVVGLRRLDEPARQWQHS